MGPSALLVRRAKVSDVPAIKRLVDAYAGKILLEKSLVTLYESVQEFWVAELPELGGRDSPGQRDEMPGAPRRGVQQQRGTSPVREERSDEADRPLGGEVVGCGALHVLWSDLGELRTVAIRPDMSGRGIGHALVRQLIEIAQGLELKRLFVLTFETTFFGRHGFVPIQGAPVTPEVYEEMLKSYDTGVAEFLDLSSIKPNTLGNTRMLLQL